MSQHKLIYATYSNEEEYQKILDYLKNLGYSTTYQKLYSNGYVRTRLNGTTAQGNTTAFERFVTKDYEDVTSKVFSKSRRLLKAIKEFQ